MANLHKIEFPEELRHHSLSEQELAPLSEQQKALAKDWNVQTKKMDWLIREAVFIHNVIAEHDALLDTWKKFLWLFTIITGGGGGIAAVIYAVMKITQGGP